jgi:ABC-type bacteriocin/lantibiotic exporter with double-glycine peptidase domain
VLYFFSRYFDRPESLNEVVALCKPDGDGLTTMRNLHHAAQQLELEPLAVNLSLEELLATNGPAIIGVRVRASQVGSGNGSTRTDGPVFHFVGYVGTKNAASCSIFDPGVATNMVTVSREQLRSIFTGYAILLKGSNTPFVRTSWMTKGFGFFVVFLSALTLWSWALWLTRAVRGNLNQVPPMSKKPGEVGVSELRHD